MKGKKFDSEFLSQFIQECIRQESNTPEDITCLALQEIEEIDQKILEVEKLRVRRSKLLDVVSTFQKPVKPDKTEESKLISFFQIKNTHICKFICDQLKEKSCTRNQLNHDHPIQDTNFCIKQLLEHKVIAKIGDSFLRGDAFEEYLKFVLQEV